MAGSQERVQRELRWYTYHMKQISAREETGQGERGNALNSRQYRQRVPQSFRPLLWSLRWKDIDVNEDKEDIIVNTINDGSLEQWRWLVATYGKDGIRAVLQKRLATEFHLESRRLASVIFGNSFAYARRNSH